MSTTHRVDDGMIDGREWDIELAVTGNCDNYGRPAVRYAITRLDGDVLFYGEDLYTGAATEPEGTEAAQALLDLLQHHYTHDQDDTPLDYETLCNTYSVEQVAFLTCENLSCFFEEGE